MKLKTYAIACTGRSGSTYLCKMLGATGQAGDPGEWFQTDGYSSPREKIGVPHETPLTDYVEALKERTSSPNGVFGIKIKGPDQWHTLQRSGLKIDYWIYLRRNNRILHAISHYRGRQTGKWQGAVNPPVEYDRKAIADLVEDKNREEQFMAQRMRNLPNHLYLCYEKALCQNPRGAVETVLNFIGSPCMEPDRIPVDCLPIQRDELSEQLAARFEEEQRRDRVSQQNR